MSQGRGYTRLLLVGSLPRPLGFVVLVGAAMYRGLQGVVVDALEQMIEEVEKLDQDSRGRGGEGGP